MSVFKQFSTYLLKQRRTLYQSFVKQHQNQSFKPIFSYCVSLISNNCCVHHRQFCSESSQEERSSAPNGVEKKPATTTATKNAIGQSATLMVVIVPWVSILGSTALPQSTVGRSSWMDSVTSFATTLNVSLMAEIVKSLFNPASKSFTLLLNRLVLSS